MAQTSTYLALIPSANASRPKFMAMVAAAVQPFVDAINFYESMTGTFALPTCVGAQLTTIGLWVGVSRFGNVPLSNWFSFDTANLGWDQGVWYQPYQLLSGVTTLDDSTLLALIQAKILWNKWDGTTPTFYTIIQTLFPNCSVAITDNLNGTIAIALNGTFPNPTIKLMATDALLPFVPLGIGVTYTFAGNQAYTLSFMNATSVAITHALGTTNVVPTVYDAFGALLEFNTFVLTDANHATLTFSVPQTGSLTLLGQGTGGGFSQSFTSQTAVTVTHGLNTGNPEIAIYDATTGSVVGYNTLTITDANHLTVTFTVAQSGRLVVLHP